MTDRLKQLASPALQGVLAQTGELDAILDGHGLDFSKPFRDPPPPAAGPGLYIPPPDWDEEERQRQAVERERQQRERDRIVAES